MLQYGAKGHLPIYKGKNIGESALNTVCEKNKCDGCMVCLDVCPRQAIKIEDSIKAYNAIIDKDNCIECGACQRVCQRNQLVTFLKRPICWKEGWAEDEEIRKKSSSGGFATAIELTFIERGGVVCSCEFSDGGFWFSFAETREQADRFKGSKYVKSNPVKIYKKIAGYIQNGKELLFVGLPCQVAAVKNYIGESERLYTVDLICHGTPSPKVLEHFLKEFNCSLERLEDISFRVKTVFGLKEGQNYLSVPVIQDYYTTAFMRSLSYTENCYDCRYAGLERVSDITLGDSWGSILPEEERRKGISLALCQTEKGQNLLRQSGLHLLEVDLECAIENNAQLRHPSVRPKKREYFLSQIVRGSKFRRIMLKCYPIRFVKDVIKYVLFKISIIRGGV